MPVLKINGVSMEPNLHSGDIVVAVSNVKLKTGTVCAFYDGSEVLVKRVIAGPGDWVDIDEDGNVTLNGEPLEETYVEEKSVGLSNIDFPYQVPDGKYFVMGDNRKDSIDSRNTAIGDVNEDDLLGRVVFCVWPLKDIGIIH